MGISEMSIMKSIVLVLLTACYVVNAEESVARAYTKHILSSILRKEQNYMENPIKRSNRNKRDVDTIMGYPEVDTTSGTATGITMDDAHAFYAIPYAEPPVGNLRFMPPQAIRTPQNINATTNNYLQCYQSTPTCEVSRPGGCESEDCLILNVFTPSRINLTDPSNPPTERLPVMFYIHGGSFKSGAGNQNELDGKNLANYTNTVIVTINYRLGPFGFLMHRQTGEDDINGNQAIKDQQLALRWVQDNIANFGGNKDEVTLFGNSAGSQSVMFHTLSSVSKDLFSRSIQQSNPAMFSFITPTVDISLRITERLIQSLNCSTQDERECLLNASPSALVAQIYTVEQLTVEEEGIADYSIETFQPIIDGTEFTDIAINLYRDGKWNKEKEMIIGVNTQESENTQFYLPPGFTEQMFLYNNALAFGEETATLIVEKYKTSFPLAEGEDYATTLGIQLSHYTFDCPNRLSARYASNSTLSSLYFYANEHPVFVPACFAANNGSTSGCYVAEHTGEIKFVMRNIDQLYDDFNENDISVQDTFNAYWGNFAQNGNPNNGDLTVNTKWPEYKNTIAAGASEPWHHMQIKAPVSEEQFAYKEDICDFWESINFGRPWTSDDTTSPSSTDSNTDPNTSVDSTTTPDASTTSKGYQFGSSILNIAMCMGFLLTF